MTDHDGYWLRRDKAHEFIERHKNQVFPSKGALAGCAYNELNEDWKYPDVKKWIYSKLRYNDSLPVKPTHDWLKQGF